MDRVVYILGTCHAYQRNDDKCEPSAIEEFRQYLKFVCQLHGIKAIGEEMSISALEENNRTQSVPAKFAQDFDNLPHKYCDPERNIQELMGISPPHVIKYLANRNKCSKEETQKQEWNENLKREPCWLCQIQDLNIFPLLFICGSDHVESFSKLLSAASFIVHIAHNKWEDEATKKIKLE